MSSRDRILLSIRSVQPPALALPALNGAWTRYDDRRGRFCEILKAVGGQAVFVKNLAELNDRLRELPAYRDAKQVCSLVEGAGQSTVDLAHTADPHALQAVDFALVAGEFAVAENGAVWITDDAIAHRVLLFIAQHVGACRTRRGDCRSHARRLYAALRRDT